MDNKNNTDWSEHRPAEFKYNGRWIHNWFSNMLSSPITIDGIRYNSVENYYQAMKSLDPDDWERVAIMSPSGSKKWGRKTKLRPDWELVKRDVMKKALLEKFSHEPWTIMLKATGIEVIVEWNNWGDRIWGVEISDNKGQNLLGKLLMEIREDLKHGK